MAVLERLHFAGASAESLKPSLLLRFNVVIGEVDGASSKLDSWGPAFEGSVMKDAEETDCKVVGEIGSVATDSLNPSDTVGVSFGADSNGG